MNCCLVVGDAPEKWDDLEVFWTLHGHADAVCCVNRAGLLGPAGFVSGCPGMLTNSPDGADNAPVRSFGQPKNIPACGRLQFGTNTGVVQ